MPVITCDKDDTTRAVVNARMLKGIAIDFERATPFEAGHESMEERLARRASTWISEVNWEKR
jgi:hypothetical protein